MSTAQSDDKTGIVFAIVTPTVKTLPPKGVTFYHFDPAEETIRLGDRLPQKPPKRKGA